MGVTGSENLAKCRVSLTADDPGDSEGRRNRAIHAARRSIVQSWLQLRGARALNTYPVTSLQDTGQLLRREPHGGYTRRTWSQWSHLRRTRAQAQLDYVVTNPDATWEAATAKGPIRSDHFPVYAQRIPTLQDVEQSQGGDGRWSTVAFDGLATGQL